MAQHERSTAYYHLPGLFEFYELYRVFLPLFREHREYFTTGARSVRSTVHRPTASGAGVRTGFGDAQPHRVLALMQEYGISARLTFSNSLLREEHLADRKCNALCALFEKENRVQNGVIVHSDLLLDYLKRQYPGPLFRVLHNKGPYRFSTAPQRDGTGRVPLCCAGFPPEQVVCRAGYPAAGSEGQGGISVQRMLLVRLPGQKALLRECQPRKNLGEDCPDHRCTAPGAQQGYRFSKAMENPGFIGAGDIRKIYLPGGFSNFKIEGRGLGSALILEFLLYYMTKPEYQLRVREEIYLDNMLDLF